MWPDELEPPALEGAEWEMGAGDEAGFDGEKDREPCSIEEASVWLMDGGACPWRSDMGAERVFWGWGPLGAGAAE